MWTTITPEFADRAIEDILSKPMTGKPVEPNATPEPAISPTMGETAPAVRDPLLNQDMEPPDYDPIVKQMVAEEGTMPQVRGKVPKVGGKVITPEHRINYIDLGGGLKIPASQEDQEAILRNQKIQEERVVQRHGSVIGRKLGASVDPVLYGAGVAALGKRIVTGDEKAGEDFSNILGAIAGEAPYWAGGEIGIRGLAMANPALKGAIQKYIASRPATAAGKEYAGKWVVPDPTEWLAPKPVLEQMAQSGKSPIALAADKIRASAPPEPVPSTTLGMNMVVPQEVRFRHNAPPEVREYLVSIQPEVMSKFADQPTERLIASPQEARMVNANPERVRDWQEIYRKAAEAGKGSVYKGGVLTTFGQVKKEGMGKLETVPVVDLTMGCQRARTTVERVQNGVLPRDTRIESCYGGECWANEQFNRSFADFENMEVRGLAIADKDSIAKWFKRKENVEFLNSGPFIRMGQRGCDSHTIASGLAEEWLKQAKAAGVKKKTIFISAGYAPVTKEQYAALAPYKDLFEIHFSNSGWFHKNEIMLRLGEFMEAREAGLNASIRLVTNKDEIAGIKMVNQDFIDKAIKDLGIKPTEVLETPFHDDSLMKDLTTQLKLQPQDVPHHMYRSNPTGKYPYVCCETKKCLTCGVKCMTKVRGGSVEATGKIPPQTAKQLSEQPGVTLGFFAGGSSTTMQRAQRMAGQGRLFGGAEPNLPEGAFTPLFEKGRGVSVVEISDKGATPKLSANEIWNFPKFLQDKNQIKQYKKGKGEVVVNRNAPLGTVRLGDIWDHPNLYREYPQMADIPVGYDPATTHTGYITVKNGQPAIMLGPGGLNPRTFKETLLHEPQHIISLWDNLSAGGNVTVAQRILEDARNTIGEDIMNIKWAIEVLRRKEAGGNFTDALMAVPQHRKTLVKSILNHVDTLDEATQMLKGREKEFAELMQLGSYDAYRSIGGERYAFANEARANMDMAQRRSTDPFATQTPTQKSIIPEVSTDTKGQLRITGGYMAKEPEETSTVFNRQFDATEYYSKRVFPPDVITPISEKGVSGITTTATAVTPPRESEDLTLGMGLGPLEAIFKRLFGQKATTPKTTTQAVNAISKSPKRMNSQDFAETVSATLDALEKDPENKILLGTKQRLFRRLGEFIEFDGGAAEFDAIAARHGMTRHEFAAKIMEEASEAGRELHQLSVLQKKINTLFKDDPLMEKMVGKDDTFLQKWLVNPYRMADNVRRQLLITQLATTARNILSQGARVAVDIFDDAIYGLYNIPKEGIRNAFRDFGEDFAALYRRLTPSGRARFENLMRRFDDIHEAMLGDNISDVAMGKYLRYLNTLNRIQEHYFRRTAFDSRFTALCKKHGLDPLTDQIPDWILKDSFDHAMEMTFQKSTGPFVEALRKMYRACPFLTTVNPFPRFWGNSFQFLVEFGPLGFAQGIRLAWNKKPAREVARAFSRGTTGMFMLGAAWELRNSAYAGEKYYEIVYDGKTYDMRPFAPFSTYLAMAEAMKPMFDKHSSMDGSDYIQAFIGINRIAGTGLAFADYALNVIRGKWDSDNLGDASKRLLADTIANFVGGYSVPLKTVKDIIASVDPTQATLQSTRVDLEAGGWKTMARPFLANVPYGNVIGNAIGGPGTVVPSTSPTRTGPIRAENPATRQFTGLSYKTKTPIEREVDRLAMRSDLAIRSGTPEIDRLTSREIAQAGFADEANDLVQSRYWKTLDDQERIAELRALYKEYKDEVRDETKYFVYKKILNSMASGKEKYEYFRKLVEKRRVNEDLLDDLIADCGKGMSNMMIDKLYKTFELKVPDPNED